MSGVHNPCGERSMQPAVTIVQNSEIYIRVGVVD